MHRHMAAVAALVGFWVWALRKLEPPAIKQQRPRKATSRPVPVRDNTAREFFKKLADTFLCAIGLANITTHRRIGIQPKNVSGFEVD